MLLNIRFYYILILFILSSVLLTTALAEETPTAATTFDVEPVLACIIPRDVSLTPFVREQLARCLAWENDDAVPTCRGRYRPINVAAPLEGNVIQIKADEVSLYSEGRSRLSGHVEVQQENRIVSAQTAYVYRDSKDNQVTKVELLGDVRYVEPGRLMIARKVTLNPQNKSGFVDDALYRFSSNRAKAITPAWGRALSIERFENKDYLLRLATYSTCPPEHESWHIEANEIKLDTANATGTAKNAVLRVGNIPVLYTPYMSFPTSNARKSGFLMPFFGYSNIGGFTAATPYYWNIAPNYDATITPQAYNLRGVMMGGKLRYLTEHSVGVIGAQVLPQDHAFNQFLMSNREEFPQLNNVSSNRWSVALRDATAIAPNLLFNVNYQQVSDPYYLQDFSTNLAILTENQLLRQGDLTYTNDHWMLRGMLQSYQTLHPVNQAPVGDAFERLPQLLAQGNYSDLPLGVNANLVGQFDYFRWPAPRENIPQGPRYHFSPVLSLPQLKPWGYITPAVELVENYYDVSYGPGLTGQSFDRTIPRYSLDSGLTFERDWMTGSGAYTQTLEPRFYYLYVPYKNQTSVPNYESAYMIFNTEQLFRNNRFSGFDRIGDSNQVSYALTSRWISDDSGQEKASLSVGQISYFSDRRVELCYQKDGFCVDNPLSLGYLAPNAKTSPIASHAVYAINSALSIVGDYIWDGHTRETNNGNLNFHYQPVDNQLLNVGYSYLVDGNLLPSAKGGVQNTALHQVTFAYASPLTDRWSTLGAYSYNISKGYTMLGLLGVQYDNCCWAVRVMGGRTFMSLGANSLQPEYNNNVYLQILLKGLGTVGYSNPSSVIRSYLPTYKGLF